MISDYLKRLEADARGAGIDPSRLSVEVADHLYQAAATYEVGGRPRAGAEALAVADLGDPQQIIMEVADIRRRPMSRTRIITVSLGLVAAIALWVSHITPSSSALESHLLAPIAVAALGLTLLVTATLVGATNRIAGTAIALIGGGVTWAVATSALADYEINIQNVSFAVAVAGLTVGLLSFMARIRGAVGLAAMASGLTVLVLNGSWDGLGGLGSGSANKGLILFTIGSCWLMASIVPTRLTKHQADRMRSAIASILRSVVNMIEPASAEQPSD
ncbi:MAG: hypothetical protein GEU71_08380 [Actinobacteria bacterium]|nr:hypothetical protein [Actinomycetota bacterium]